MSTTQKLPATILLIDDEQIVHDSIRRILESEDYRIDGAYRVAEAMEKLNSQSYDLVLTDLMMPDDSGMKAVELVAKNHSDCGVVMFTGYSTVESAVQSMKLGALDYLPKPFLPEELIEVVEKALRSVRKSRRDKEIEATYAEAEQAIRSSLDLKEVLNLICSSLTRLLKMKGCCLFLLDRRKQELELVAWKGLSPSYLDKGVVTPTAELTEALQSDELLIISESEFDEKLQYPKQAKAEGIRAIISHPVKLGDAVLGLLRLYANERPSLTKDEADILVRFAMQGARAIENAMAFERVKSDIEELKKQVPQAFASEA